MDTEQLVIIILRALLILGAALNIIFVIKAATSSSRNKLQALSRIMHSDNKNNLYLSFTGFIANFCDVLGIGSFAIAASMSKVKKCIDDKKLPGTLNVGFTIPTCLQAFLFIGSIEADAFTLVVLIIMSVVGSYLGARVITRLNRCAIRFAMCFGLFIVGTLMILKQLHIGPFGMTGFATGLEGFNLFIASIIALIIGSLMNIGVGCYAPFLALVLIMGMDPTIAYPIMTGSSAYISAFGCGPKFIKEKSFDFKAAILFAITGTVGVLICFFFVFSYLKDHIQVLIWIVIIVIYVTSLLFLKDAIKDLKKD